MSERMTTSEIRAMHSVTPMPPEGVHVLCDAIDDLRARLAAVEALCAATPAQMSGVVDRNKVRAVISGDGDRPAEGTQWHACPGGPPRCKHPIHSGEGDRG